jgi:endoglucanase
MNKIIKILKEFTTFPSPSGYEKFLSQKIKEKIEKYLDEVKIDGIGNLIGIKRGKGKKKIMISSHIDEIFMYVKKIEKKFAIVGTYNIDKKILEGQEVILLKENGKKIEGVIGSIPPHLKEEVKEKEIFVDFGENPEKLGIKIGDIITFKGEFGILNKTKIFSKSLDARICIPLIFLLIEKINKKLYHKELIFLLNVQEETGGYGGLVRAFDIYPDECIVLDATFGKSFYDKEEIEIGKGPAIGIGPFIDKKISQKMIRICKKYKIPYQIEVLPQRTGTDLDRISLLKEGIPCGLLSIPIRYMHTPVEVGDINDIKWGAKLLEKYLEEK